MVMWRRSDPEELVLLTYWYMTSLKKVTPMNDAYRKIYTQAVT